MLFVVVRSVCRLLNKIHTFLLVGEIRELARNLEYLSCQKPKTRRTLFMLQLCRCADDVVFTRNVFTTMCSGLFPPVTQYSYCTCLLITYWIYNNGLWKLTVESIISTKKVIILRAFGGLSVSKKIRNLSVNSYKIIFRVGIPHQQGTIRFWCQSMQIAFLMQDFFLRIFPLRSRGSCKNLAGSAASVEVCYLRVRVVSNEIARVRINNCCRCTSFTQKTSQQVLHQQSSADVALK